MRSVVVFPTPCTPSYPTTSPADTTVVDAVLGRNVFIHSYSHIEQSIIMNDTRIHHHTPIRHAIVDKNAQVPTGATIGWDVERDRQRFTVTASGILVVPKDYIFTG